MVKKLKFKDFLKRSKIPVDILDNSVYKRVTIKIKHGGVSLRDFEIGKKIGTKKQFILKEGQFILSKIDARYGAFGIAPKEVNDAIITGNFWAYDVDDKVIDIDWFNQFTNSKDFYDLCERASSGITHRKYLSEDLFLNNELNVPDLNEQKFAVQRIDNLKFCGNNISTELTHQLSLISQLRQAFLREAMQGTLVSNETKDGATGNELLAEILAEKEQLVKAKKIKKQKPLPPISEEDIPFEIPENWVWCRLGEINEFNPRNKVDDDLKVGFCPMPLIYSKYGKSNDFQIKLWKEIKSGFTHFQNDDVVVAKITPCFQNSKSAVISGLPNGFGAGTTELYVLRPFQKILPKFIYSLIKNPDFLSAGQMIMRGVAGQQRVPKEFVEEYLVPLPPLEIQERIVAKLDELMHYCDALENSVKESQNSNNLLLQQVLREALEGGKNKKEEEILPMVAEDAPIYSTNKKYDMSDMAILAGHIINTHSTSNDKDFGRVKLQKMLHLVQFHCNLDTPLQYQKKVAGPYCRDLESQIEQKLKQLRFFDIKKEKIKDYEQVVYTKLASSKDLDRLFANEFEHKADEINSLLQKFRSKNTNFCEAVSTMYAVWNNRILKKEPITDELLKTDFLNWDESKKKFIGKLDDVLDWMRKNGVVPVGSGKVI